LKAGSRRHSRDARTDDGYFEIHCLPNTLAVTDAGVTNLTLLEVADPDSVGVVSVRIVGQQEAGRARFARVTAGGL
jgi:hypothetical protein